MRRRPSGSSIEEEELPSSAPEHGDKRKPDPKKTRPSKHKASEKRQQGAAGPLSGGKAAWNPPEAPSSGIPTDKDVLDLRIDGQDISPDDTMETRRRKKRLRNPWTASMLMLATLATSALLGVLMLHSFTSRQLDPKGCRMSFMASAFARFPDFDTEHTRFASKYSLYLYREMGVDEDTRVKGVPVLFIPGNAGSYKQTRSLAAEAAYYYRDAVQRASGDMDGEKRPIDFFSVDFNEDITAFHGQTLLDQAEYLNDAIAYILSLYHKPETSLRDSELPDPSSVILVGHSMGGIVARTMLTMSNYQPNSVNTIVTLSAPHARPPVSFDADIVSVYKRINDYWRNAYSQEHANDNPLWHVTLISIAGGGLDTIVPSDYASLASLVPDTHGFTVFTSTIPGVWTGMDHLAITWCDQFRKSVIRAIYDVIDVSRPSQTRLRAARMRAFKKWFLTGLEDVSEKTLPHRDPKTLLTLEDNANSIISQGERLVVRTLGDSQKRKAYLLPVPPQGTPEGRKFTLLSNQKLDAPGENGNLEVLFCSVFPLQAGQSAALFSMNMDLSGDSSGATRLACKSAATDVISLPASTAHSCHPFDFTQEEPCDPSHPFSYLQYDLEDLAEHQFVAVVDKATEPAQGWVVAEFSAGSESMLRIGSNLRQLLTTGLDLRLPKERPMLVEIKIPALSSSLLAYNLKIDQHTESTLFSPLMRQYVTDVYESRFFVNVKEVNVSLHGVAPYMPRALQSHRGSEGLALQVWSDPTESSAMNISIRIDVFGSMGKLWMRYRTLFAAFPLLVVALVLRRQFKVYDETGIFMSFSESMSQCLRKSLPALLCALSCFSMFLSTASQLSSQQGSSWLSKDLGNATEGVIDYTRNDLLIGSQDTFFGFLVPVFGVICAGICVAVNYLALGLTHLFAAVYARLRSTAPRRDDGSRSPTAFALTSTRKRVLTTSLLLLLVSTVIPYQFAYLVLCLVQISTCVRACRLVRETRADSHYNFYNYAHSILVLMLWILPINMPVLVVWVRNLAVHWLTPFSSHHNILSITPYILLAETLSTGRMVPRVTSRIRYMTNTLLFIVAVCSAIYGVTYAYLLHHLVNILYAWLVIIHLSTSSFSPSRLDQLLEDPGAEDGVTKKRP